MKVVIFGGGGKISRIFAQLAVKTHQVVSVVRNDTQ